MNTLSTHKLPDSQRGAVLVIALIMLLILTLIGVAGLRDTQLQERMAGGAQDRELALQAAEAALREAESEVADGNVADIDAGDAVKDYNTDPVSDLERTDSGGNPVTEAAFWRDHYDWAGANKAINYTGALTQISQQPQYVIEQLPSAYSAIPGTTNAGTAPTTGVRTITDYLITARGTGLNPDTVVILQTQYRHITIN